MNLYLIRHGEKVEHTVHDDVASITLTDKGHRQADLCGQRLLQRDIRMIYASTMTRAMQTADEINKYLHVHIEARDALKEIDMGECATRGWDYVHATYPHFQGDFQKHETDVSYPQGECGADVWNRAKHVIDEIIQLGLENVAVVAHGGTIRSIICGSLGLPQEKRFFLGMPPEHCSISILKYQDERFYLHTFNDYTHLGDLL